MKKNYLAWGIHNGTLMSRDVGDPKECYSLAAARLMADKIDKDARRTGYMLWFANWFDENGKEHSAHPGNAYVR